MSLFVLLLIGVSCVLAVRPLVLRSQSIILSMPIGAVFWCFACILLLMLDLSLNFFGVLITSIALLAACSIFSCGGVHGPKAPLLHLLDVKSLYLPVMLLVVAYVACMLFPEVIISGDSLIISYMSFLISEGEGGVTDLGRWYLWGWPIVLPLTSFEFDGANLESFSSLPLAASISLFFALAAFSYEKLRSAKYSLPSSLGISFLVVFFTFSSELSVYNFFYLNHHSLVAVFLLLFVVVLSRGINEGREQNEVGFFVVVTVVGVSMSRHEGAFISLAMILLFAERFRDRAGWVLKVVTVSSAAIVFYLSFLLLNGSDASGVVLSERIILLMILLHVLVPVVLAGIYLLDYNEIILKYNFLLLVIFLLCGQFFGFVFNEEVYIHSLRSLYANLFGGDGFWGSTWFVAITVFTFSLVLSQTIKVEHKLLVIFSLLVLSMPVVRDMPFRTGLGDSANRMFLHVLPVVSLLILDSFVELRKKLMPE